MQPMDDMFVITMVYAEHEGWRINDIANHVSDPQDPSYGQHLDRDELEQLVLLSAEENQTIQAWLDAHGLEILESPESSPQLVFVRGTLDQIVSAFGEDLAGRLQRDHLKEIMGTRGVLRLPLNIAGYVQKVGGLPGAKGQLSEFVGAATDTETRGSANASRGSKPVGPNSAPSVEDDLDGLSPADVREIYQIPDEWDGSGETIGIMMLGGEVDHEELQYFWRAHGITRPDIKEVTLGPKPDGPSHALHQLELSMVIEWAGAMAPGAEIVAYHIDPTKIGDPWAAFMFGLVGDKVHAPTIGCTSWITPERQYYRLHGHQVVTGLLTQIAALGITFISAAGDWGTFDGIPRITKDGRKVTDAPWPHGVFPAVESRVLAVGGTMITTRRPLTEVAWSGPPPPGLQKAVHFEMLAGSGGFSQVVPIPDWQQDILRGYYPRGAGRPSVVPYGRGFPDVSIAASGPSVQRGPGEPLTMQGYQVFCGGRWLDYGGGTSTGAPIWAAIIAMVNQACRAAGKSRVGFVNPALYAVIDVDPTPFREIAAGSSDVAIKAVDPHGRAVTYEIGGYQAVHGWDPVTGLGVPNVANLIKALTESPNG